MNDISLQNSFSPVNTSALGSSALNGDSNSELNQSDFIELLVAQVKNQDPTKPMDPSQFMNQLAQFSTVNGVQELKGSFDSLATKLSSDQSLQAAGLVGRSVLIQGSSAILNQTGVVSGQIDLTESANDMKLRIIDANGEHIRTLPLGSHPAGPVQFQWDGFTDGGAVAPYGQYRVAADALVAGSTQALDVSVETRINSITLNQDGTGTSLNLANGDTVSLASVQQFR